MKHFAGYALTAFLAFTFGAIYDATRMANDEEFHDYWMKRAKKLK